MWGSCWLCWVTQKSVKIINRVNQEREKTMDDKTITIDLEQFKILRDGVHTWNTICLNSLTERGRKKIFDAQDLVDKLWRESNFKGRS